MRANFTGLSDDDLFGPAFLYEEPELFIEKKLLPTNTNHKRYEYSPKEEYYQEDDYEEEDDGYSFECGCGALYKYGEDCQGCEVPKIVEEKSEEAK